MCYGYLLGGTKKTNTYGHVWIGDMEITIYLHQVLQMECSFVATHVLCGQFGWSSPSIDHTIKSEQFLNLDKYSIITLSNSHLQ